MRTKTCVTHVPGHRYTVLVDGVLYMVRFSKGVQSRLPLILRVEEVFSGQGTWVYRYSKTGRYVLSLLAAHLLNEWTAPAAKKART